MFSGETGLSPGWRLWFLATFHWVDVCQIAAAVSIQHSGTGTCEKVTKGLQSRPWKTRSAVTFCAFLRHLHCTFRRISYLEEKRHSAGHATHHARSALLLLAVSVDACEPQCSVQEAHRVPDAVITY